MLFAGREVRIGKNCARGLEYGPRDVLKTDGTVFCNKDQPRPANNVFIFFCGKLLKLLKQFHTVHVRLKYVFFLWIIKFTFAMIAVIIQKAAKIAAILENSERSIHRVQMGNSGPL